MRNYQEIKKLSDYQKLDAPKLMEDFDSPSIKRLNPNLYILRMLVQPKYSTLQLPTKYSCLQHTLQKLKKYDQELTGIDNSWIYLTIRRGTRTDVGDNKWHFDGSSFRTSTIPERNYVWCDAYPFQYKLGYPGELKHFNPMRNNLHCTIKRLTNQFPIHTSQPKQWYMVNPFCFHRRQPLSVGSLRTFIRISFLDVEIRDKNNTQNPLIPTNAYGRDPVEAFRNKLV